MIAGLARHPAAIPVHAEALARLAGEDPRFDCLLDAAERADALEKTAVATILADKGHSVPQPEDYARIPFPFVAEDADPDAAAEGLAAAIAILVEEPAIDAAIEQATARLDFEEQQRLLKRKLEFATRLRQMAGARNSVSAGHGRKTTAE